MLKITMAVPIDELVKECEYTQDQWEVHDERGDPTGKFNFYNYLKITTYNGDLYKISMKRGWFKDLNNLLGTSEAHEINDIGFLKPNEEYDGPLPKPRRILFGKVLRYDYDNMPYIQEIQDGEYVDASCQVSNAVIDLFGVTPAPRLYVETDH